MGHEADADPDAADLLREQLAYYRAGAAEYDGIYDRRPDLRGLLPLLDRLPVRGDVLELACGTGQWTERLAARARTVTAVDAAPETLAIARDRVTSRRVSFIRADLFAWDPPRRFDTVFFAFWLSHVPPPLMPAFWHTVAAALAPGGTAVFVDTGRAEAADEDILPGHATPSVRRRLDNGTEYRIVKVFHDARQLTADLAALGWTARVHPVGRNFITGTATPTP